MRTYEEAQQIAKKLWELDIYDGVQWWADYTADDELKCTINCSDLFFWGCSDSEEVELSNLHLVQEAHDELKALNISGHAFEAHTNELFCAKSRKMRPQGAYYAEWNPIVWPLFNACGPYREACFGNPKATPE